MNKERAFTSSLLNEKRKGIFKLRICNQNMTVGWPSFTEQILIQK